MTDLTITASILTAAETATVDGAVHWLNHAVRASGIQLAAQVNQFILDTFFGGNYESFSDPSSSKPVSFGALCAREDLHLGQTSLYRLVRIGQQIKHLPSEVAEALSMTHHRTLLAVTDQRHLHRLAREAMLHRWTATELEAQVHEVQPAKGGKTGRPRVPDGLKWLGAVLRASEGDKTAQLAKDFTALSEAKQADVRAKVAELRKLLDAVNKVVG